ncbi:50S ribosomal protein L9 [Patescibacteria group bacterium]|nr:50S ribosomal protein L9 [Patescibacteria group bacterium]MBU4022963.1 50S ribosomal protein L9 [Patescibacteria group bacterium]MBU4078090.1 50S ribosomal protein L9 [Patescibacteria group bacterium]
MKVILLKDIENIGRKNQVKNVKDGYVRNFLIPKGLAKIADKKSLLGLENMKEQQAIGAEEELKKAQSLASKLDGQEIEFIVKIGKKDQLFEAVSRAKIAEKLKELDFDIKKEQIALDKPIKQLGEFPIKIELEHHLEASITLIIESEPDTEKKEKTEE